MPTIKIFSILTSTVDGTSPAVEDTKKQGVAEVYSTRPRVGAKSGKASFSAAGSSQSKSQIGLGSDAPDSASSDVCLKDDLGNYNLIPCVLLQYKLWPSTRYRGFI